MEQQQVNNLSVLKQRRKELRTHLTPPEARMWIWIKGTQLGTKFRRQHSVGKYILDFYCSEYKLAVEIDGAFHDSNHSYAYNQARTNFLVQNGIKVLRFTNKDVMNNLEGVLLEIKKHLQKG